MRKKRQSDMENDAQKTLLKCFRELVRTMPRAPEIEAIYPETPPEDERELCVLLAEKLKLQPERREGVELDELAAYFGAPVFLMLKNGNWVFYLGVRRLQRGGKPEERYAIYDPLGKGKQQMLLLKREQLEKAWGGDAVFIKQELNDCSTDGRHTLLFSLGAVVKHHRTTFEIGRILHDYAISEDEPSVRLLRKIADDLNFKNREVKLSWTKLEKMGASYPFLLFKRDGRAAVACGVREVKTEEETPFPSAEGIEETTEAPAEAVSEAIPAESTEAPAPAENAAAESTEAPAPAETEAKKAKKKATFRLAVWDPLATEGKRPEIVFYTEEEFDETFTGKALLLKRRYSLTDENQPFGLKWFIPEFYRQRGLLTQVALSILAISLIGLAVPLFFQLVVDKVLVHESANTLQVLGIAVLVMLAFDMVLSYTRSYFLLFATNRIDIRLATKVFTKLLSLPVDFYEKIPSGVLIKHMQQTERIRSFLSGSLFFSLLELFSLLIFLPILLFYSVKLTLVVLLFTFLMAAVIASLIKPFQQRLEELYMAEGQRQSMLVETIQGIRTVKSLALEPTQQRKWNDTSAFAITRHFRVAKISITASSLSGFLEKAMFVAIVWIGANSVFEHTMTVGALIAFQMLSGRVTGPLVHIIGLVHEYQQTLLSVKMLGVVMNCPEERVGGTLSHKLQGELSIENVTFQYSADTPQVIKDVSLHLTPGMTVGLVGRSGSGKTTLTKLIQGLYPLQGGIIKYDGIDIREIDRASLRSSIGIVLQDNYFFHGTVRENLSLTKPQATMEEIIYSARMAGCDEFIQKMPKGYETMLEENASNLSGGQRQRLAIARALLPNPRFLIFDEATSALDPESETLVRKNLKMIARNRTMFIISHRLSILCRADKIVVMDKGKFAEEGTHKELLQKGGIYADFWKQQMGTDDED